MAHFSLTQSHPAPPQRRNGFLPSRAQEHMVREQLEGRGISDPQVLAVMRELPRHLFVDEALEERAYGDVTLPIGEKQTLSRPYTVARMTEALRLTGQENILEIGTGSGYQTAILARLGHHVHTIERLPELAHLAARRLRSMGLHNVTCLMGDGSLGWPEERQFDRIMVTAGAPVVPQTLMQQLTLGGVMVIPMGSQEQQQLLRIVNHRHGEIREILEPCCFVPLLGAQGWH
ncbi:MAG: protein-L-isoaspartate(D-aspartate) O-methyltransferase [Magnetococcales bacterium]|nr:protein-L-isoaspartate(D-aspartate) O-methyltransferase [Magnetococcales bacterium]